MPTVFMIVNDQGKVSNGKTNLRELSFVPFANSNLGRMFREAHHATNHINKFPEFYHDKVITVTEFSLVATDKLLSVTTIPLKAESIKRVPILFTTSPETTDMYGSITTICNDGTIWELTLKGDPAWKQLPSIPSIPHPENNNRR